MDFPFRLDDRRSSVDAPRSGAEFATFEINISLLIQRLCDVQWINYWQKLQELFCGSRLLAIMRYPSHFLELRSYQSA